MDVEVRFTTLHLQFCPTGQVAYKKDAKASLHYTTVVDRPDIKKATQAAKLISQVTMKYTDTEPPAQYT